MKFAMGATTLGTLTTKTSSSHDDLTAHVKAFLDAADDIKNSFHGAGREAFDKFKLQVDGDHLDLNAALASVLRGVQGQDRAFKQGDQQMAESMGQMQAKAAFLPTRFSSK